MLNNDIKIRKVERENKKREKLKGYFIDLYLRDLNPNIYLEKAYTWLFF